MTRLSLISFAILANACAPAEGLQDDLTDITHELQRDINEMTTENHTDADTHRQLIYDRIHDVYESRSPLRGCEIVGALAGGWADRSFQLKTHVISESGKVVASMAGQMRYIDNTEGVFSATGKTSKRGTTMKMVGDWYRDNLEADISVHGIDDEHLFFTGVKSHRGLGGQVMGVVVACD